MNATEKITAALETNPGLTAKEVAVAAGVGASTAANLLTAWAKDGVVSRVEQDRGAARWYPAAVAADVEPVTADEPVPADITPADEPVPADITPAEMLAAHAVTGPGVGDADADVDGGYYPSTERPGPRTERKAKARKAANARVTAAKAARAPKAPAAPAVDVDPAVEAARQAEVRGNLRTMTLEWHADNRGTAASANELRKAFGAKWAGPIRLHQRKAVDDGLLVRVGEKPETYMWRKGAELPAADAADTADAATDTATDPQV